jgi:hypothetical protein
MFKSNQMDRPALTAISREIEAQNGNFKVSAADWQVRRAKGARSRGTGFPAWNAHRAAASQ